MNRVFNFSAGPSMLPVPVLEKAAAELVCYGESGMSVMEMSHRSPDYEAIIAKTQADLSKLMNIPENYKVLFLQGGATTQFAAIPMNLMKAESPGPSVGKLVPRMRYTARILYVIYFVLTILELISLLLVKMPWFDAVCISIGTAGTGGFGILNSSCGAYSVSAQWIITIFMILFSINFNAFYLILFGQIKNALKMECSTEKEKTLL